MSLLQHVTPVPISQYDEEFFMLLHLFKWKNPGRILEIGTHHGGTFFHWVKNAPDGATVISVDNQQINSSLYKEWADDRVTVDFYLGDSTSHHALQWLQGFKPFDFIFIDGDHYYEGVKSDWINSQQLIAPGGIIAFHDITPHENRQVDTLWTEIKNQEGEDYICTEIIEDHPEPCGIGVVQFAKS